MESPICSCQRDTGSWDVVRAPGSPASSTALSSAAICLCGIHSGEAERGSAIGTKLFGLIPEPVFTFIPESCPKSPRNTVRNHPGIAFTLPRIL